jgi:hypothetical protein
VWLKSKEENDREMQEQQSSTESLKGIFDPEPKDLF